MKKDEWYLVVPVYNDDEYCPSTCPPRELAQLAGVQAGHVTSAPSTALVVPAGRWLAEMVEDATGQVVGFMAYKIKDMATLAYIRRPWEKKGKWLL